MLDLNAMGVAARQAARTLALSSDASRRQALAVLADGLEREQTDILAANAQDIAAAGTTGLSAALIDRLTLTPARLRGIAADVRVVAALPDPLGERLRRRQFRFSRFSCAKEILDGAFAEEHAHKFSFRANNQYLLNKTAFFHFIFRIRIGVCA